VKGQYKDSVRKKLNCKWLKKYSGRDSPVLNLKQKWSGGEGVWEKERKNPSVPDGVYQGPTEFWEPVENGSTAQQEAQVYSERAERASNFQKGKCNCSEPFFFTRAPQSRRERVVRGWDSGKVERRVKIQRGGYSRRFSSYRDDRKGGGSNHFS